jgi:hypothetical protein
MNLSILSESLLISMHCFARLLTFEGVGVILYFLKPAHEFIYSYRESKTSQPLNNAVARLDYT